jgi:cytidylate kinase
VIWNLAIGNIYQALKFEHLKIQLTHEDCLVQTNLVHSAIAIDGPAASGKSTVGRMLADKLGYLFLDTGCMYRAVTLAVIRRKVDINDEQAVVSLTESLDLAILPPVGSKDGRLYTVLLSGYDITWDLRLSEVDVNVSQVSAYKGVRRDLVQRQREIANQGKVVVVGRDIGTVVLPSAPLKLFVIASTEERARRRWLEQLERTEDVDYEQILNDIIRRDRFDGNREHSPLRQSADAIVVDTTNKSPERVLEEILALEYFQPIRTGSELE